MRFALLFTLTFSYSAAMLAADSNTVVIKDTRKIEKRYKLIPLGIIEYADANRVCRPWLSKGGLLVHEKSRSSILVYDTPQVIKKITDFLRKADNEAPNIKVTFDMDSAGIGKVQYIKGKPVRFKKGEKSGKHTVKAISDIKEKQRFTSQFIVTRSGLSALIWVGSTSMPPSWYNYACYNHGRVIRGKNGILKIKSRINNTKPVETRTTLQVRPFWRTDGTIDVEIYPEIRYTDKAGQQQTAKLRELATSIRVKEGQRIQIGSILEQQHSNYSNIFGPTFFSRKDITKISQMYLKAERASSKARFFNKR